MTACRTLKDLAARGFLLKHSSGRASGKTASRRAAIYGLADPDTLPCGGTKTPGRKGRKEGT